MQLMVGVCVVVEVMTKMRTRKTLISAAFLWISLGTFHKVESEAAPSSAAAAAAAAEPCDLHLWYLDRVLEGAFSGELSREQSGIKTRIESLIEKNRHTATPGLITCSTLAAFENVLNQARSRHTGGGHVGDEPSSDEDLRGRERSGDPSLVHPKETADDGDHVSSRGEKEADREMNTRNARGQKDKEDGDARDRECGEKESSRLEHCAGWKPLQEKNPQQRSNSSDKGVDRTDVKKDGYDSKRDSVEKSKEFSDGTRQNEQSDSRQDQRNTQNTDGQTTPGQECMFTPALKCADESRTSRWLDYMFQPLLLSLIHAPTSSSFNIFVKCRTSACSKRSKRRTGASDVHCQYYNTLSNAQRRRRNSSDSCRVTVAHFIKDSCQLAQQCSWQCFYGMLKQQCIQHYDFGINTAQPSSIKDDTKFNNSSGYDDAKARNSEAETGESEPHELDAKETKRPEQQEELPGESHGDDLHPDSDDSNEELVKNDVDRVSDETEVDGALPAEKQAKQHENADVLANKNAQDQSRDTFDCRKEKENTSHKTHELPERKETQNDDSNANGIPTLQHEGHGPPSLSEAELVKLETMLQHKALQQESKIQSLEILIMRLENHILSQKLSEQNGTSHIVHMENQILRIENALLKLNQSYVALQAENDMLKSRQNKYLALEHKSKEENKHISLPSNTSDYFRLVLVQQEKITLLKELLNNQSSALHKLQSKSMQLEEQNQVLYQIVLNQTVLISHVMQKLQELSEQTLNNQQETRYLKSVVDLHSVSSSIITKLERVLHGDSSNAGSPSDKNVPSRQSSVQTDSNSSRHHGRDVLEFLQSLSEYSSRLQHWKCGNTESSRLCLYSSVMVSPCPPFRPLSWGRCVLTIFLTGSAKNAMQIPGISIEPPSVESHTMKTQSMSGPTQRDVYQKNEHSRKDLSDALSTGDHSMHKGEERTEGNEEAPDSVEIPNAKYETHNVKSVSSNSGAETGTADHQADSGRDTLHVSDVLTTTVTAEDGGEQDSASSQQTDGIKRSENDMDGHESKGREREDAKEKTLKLGTNGNQAKTWSDGSGISKQKEESTRTHQDIVKKLVEKGTQSGPAFPSHASDLMKQHTEENTADVKMEAHQTADVKMEAHQTADVKMEAHQTADVKMEAHQTCSNKDGSTDEGMTEEKRRKEEAEKATRAKKEAEALQKRIQDAETRHPAYWSTDHRKPKDCYDLYKRAPAGQARNGAYKVFVKGLNLYVTVYCDLRAGGWTVLMKREDGSLDFYRDWEEYKDGFGTPFGEHYLGNEVVHYLSNQDQYSLQVDLMDWQGNSRTASYRHFWIEEEEHKFKLHVLDYSGTAGDGLAKHDGMLFSTKDRDHDLLGPEQMGGSCARRFQGAGWYYKCYMSNLMGVHYQSGAVPDKRFDGITWKPWMGPSYSLKEVVLKVRPRLAG